MSDIIITIITIITMTVTTITTIITIITIYIGKKDVTRIVIIITTITTIYWEERCSKSSGNYGIVRRSRLVQAEEGVGQTVLPSVS